MSIAFPFIDHVEQFEPGADAYTLATRSVMNQSLQTTSTLGRLWTFGMVLRAGSIQNLYQQSLHARIEGWLDGLNGQEIRVAHWHYARRYGRTGHGTPMGTINTTGVEVKTTIAQLASAVVLKDCGNAKTLYPGDMFKIGDQLFMNPALATATAGGDMTVQLPARARVAYAADAPVTLIRPTVDCVLKVSNWQVVHRPGQVSVIALDWVEA